MYKLKWKKLNGKIVEIKYPTVLYHLTRNTISRCCNKFDNVIIITGKVGSGKSNLAIGIAMAYEIYMNRILTLDNIHFRVEDVLTELWRDDNYTSTIIHDEAIQGSSTRDTTSNKGKFLHQALITKRYKRHLIILNIDNIKELTKKVIERSVCWIHCTYFRKVDKYIRGVFRVFSPKDAAAIYIALKSGKIIYPEEHPIFKRNKSIHKAPYYFNYMIDEEEYEKKKDYYTSLAQYKMAEKIIKSQKKNKKT